jgi:hypothetical protein
MAKKGRLRLWTLVIPLAIGIVFVWLDIWPGKAVRIFRRITHQSKQELIGEFGEDDWEWSEKGHGYVKHKKELVRHGKWVETTRDQFSGTWQCEGEYEDGYRDGSWVVTRDGELFREYIFDEGRLVRVRRSKDIKP